VDPEVATTNQSYVFANDDPINAEDPMGTVAVALMGGGYQTAIQQQASLNTILDEQGINTESVSEQKAIASEAQAQTLLYDVNFQKGSSIAEFKYITTNNCLSAMTATCMMDFAALAGNTSFEGNVQALNELSEASQDAYDASKFFQSAKATWTSFGPYVNAKSVITTFADTDQEAGIVYAEIGNSADLGDGLAGDAEGLANLFTDFFG
jgi:hypothetical protein